MGGLWRCPTRRGIFMWTGIFRNLIDRLIGGFVNGGVFGFCGWLNGWINSWSPDLEGVGDHGDGMEPFCRVCLN